MGFRTVVILYNDQIDEWANDAELGRRIASGINDTNDKTFDSPANLQINNLAIGNVAECTHADSQTLAVVDSYHMTPLAYGHWYQGQTHDQRDLALLKQLAAKMGYTIQKNALK